MHNVIKTLFAQELSFPGLKRRLLNPETRAHNLVVHQTCEIMSGAAREPILYMVRSALQAECLPSFIVSILFCAQKALFFGDVLEALRFADTSLVGGVFVAPCLRGPLHDSGSRSAWPLTVRDIAAHLATMAPTLHILQPA